MEPIALVGYADKNKKLLKMDDYMLIKFDKQDIVNLKKIGFVIQTKSVHNNKAPMYIFKNIKGIDNFVTGLKHPFMFINNAIVTCSTNSGYNDEGYHLCNKELFIRNCKTSDPKPCKHIENIMKTVYPSYTDKHYTKQELHNLRVDIAKKQKETGYKIKKYQHLLITKAIKNPRLINIRQILKSKYAPKDSSTYTLKELKPYMSKLFGKSKSRRSRSRRSRSRARSKPRKSRRSKLRR